MIRIGIGPYTHDARHAVDVKVFKGGEVNVVIPHNVVGDLFIEEKVAVVAHLTNSDLVMAFFLTIDALRRLSPTVKIYAYIPYLPYARQDRVCNLGEALSIGLFAKMLNAMDLTSVKLLDPHSDVSSALIERSLVITQSRYLQQIVGSRYLNIDTENLWLIAPDAGAMKKTKLLSEELQKNGLVSGYMTAAKERDLVTMDLAAPIFHDDVLGKNCLVVDDICDGGRTFVKLGKKLREQGCKELSLFVTHGIFSYGVEELLEVYDRIYTTDSFHPDQYSAFRELTKGVKDKEGISRFHWFQV